MTPETSKKNNNIVGAVVKTIAFFNLFEYPMTALEIWRSLSIKCNFPDIIKVLEHLTKNNIIAGSEGFYYLAWQQKNLITRKRRYNHTNRKFKRVKWVVYLFRFIPWIKMIAVGNMIGANNLKDKGDIDIFIITTAQRVWLTRFSCSTITKILKLRPRPGQEKDAICLSFYISEDQLNIKNLLLHDNDIYFINWLLGLYPVYDKDDTYNKFIQANKWWQAEKPNWRPIVPDKQRHLNTWDLGFFGEIIDLLVGGLEANLKKLQLNILPQRYLLLMNKDTRVVINNATIKLHENDRREMYWNKYQELLNELNI